MTESISRRRVLQHEDLAKRLHDPSIYESAAGLASHLAGQGQCALLAGPRLAASLALFPASPSHSHDYGCLTCGGGGGGGGGGSNPAIFQPRAVGPGPEQLRRLLPPVRGRPLSCWSKSVSLVQ